MTWTREEPSWVLSRSRAVLAAVGFSKVTSADCVSPSDLTLRELILPLRRVLASVDEEQEVSRTTHQKLKKSRTSFSLVLLPMFLTWTVVEDMLVVDSDELLLLRMCL